MQRFTQGCQLMESSFYFFFFLVWLQLFLILHPNLQKECFKPPDHFTSANLRADPVWSAGSWLSSKQAVSLPVEVRHDGFRSVSPSFLQNADDLEGRIAVPAGVDDHRAPQLCLGARGCLEHPAFARGQGPGAADFPHHATLDVSPIRSVEDLTNNDVCKLKNGKMRYLVSNIVCVTFGWWTLCWSWGPFEPT